MKDFKFSKEEIEKINKAAAKVESVSSGEVLTAVIKESSDYAFAELLFSLFCGFIYFLIALFFYNNINTTLEGLFWTPAAWHTTAFFGSSTILVIGLFYIISNIPGFDRLIVPKAVMAKNVHKRALLYFTESGAVNTKDRTGILFFVSLRERQVEIIADKGINDKVKPEYWQKIVEGLINSIKNKQAATGLEKAIAECTSILEKNFPVQADDVNELKDGIVFLDE